MLLSGVSLEVDVDEARENDGLIVVADTNALYLALVDDDLQLVTPRRCNEVPIILFSSPSPVATRPPTTANLLPKQTMEVVNKMMITVNKQQLDVQKITFPCKRRPLDTPMKVYIPLTLAYEDKMMM